MFLFASNSHALRRVRRTRRRDAAIVAGVLLVTAIVGGIDRTAAAGSTPTVHYRLVARSPFSTPQYYGDVAADTMFNTTLPNGTIIITGNDTEGTNNACGTAGKDIAILRATGSGPSSLSVSTVNCMPSFGPKGGGNSPDGCSWKTAGITAVGTTLYLAVARQLHACSYGHQANGLQPSVDASIIKSTDGGKTWTNPWGTHSADGAAPPWLPGQNHYQAMFPGRSFSTPFFIQYAPGDRRTVDGGGKYLYAVSTDGYAYNGNYLHLARVPRDRVLQARAWRYYHGAVGGAGRDWTSSPAGATRVLQARQGVSQPAIQYVPALRKYVLSTFSFTRAHPDFPNRWETPYTSLRVYTARKPWGPWTRQFDRQTQRNLWCAAGPCPLVRQPTATPMTVGTPTDWLGLYDPAIVQKFVYTRAMAKQALFTGGDWKNQTKYGAENLYRLHVLPTDLNKLTGS